MNLLKNVKITKVVPSFTAGQTNRDGTILDMSGYEGVLFIASFGVLLATGTLELVVDQNDADSSSGMAELEGTVTYTVPATPVSEVCLALDIYKPMERFVRCGIELGTANAEIDGVIAIQYKGKKAPIAQSELTTGVVAQLTSISPDEA